MRVSIFPLLLLATTVVAQTPTLEQSYKTNWAPRLVPLLTEVIRFPTVAGDAKAFADQKAWLTRVATELGFTVRDKGKVTEVELPGPAGAPVLGLAVHGDLVPDRRRVGDGAVTAGDTEVSGGASRHCRVAPPVLARRTQHQRGHVSICLLPTPALWLEPDGGRQSREAIDLKGQSHCSAGWA